MSLERSTLDRIRHELGDARDEGRKAKVRPDELAELLRSAENEAELIRSCAALGTENRVLRRWQEEMGAGLVRIDENTRPKEPENIAPGWSPATGGLSEALRNIEGGE